MTAAAPPPPAAQAAVVRNGFLPASIAQDSAKPRPSVRAHAARAGEPRAREARAQAMQADSRATARPHVNTARVEGSRMQVAHVSRVASLYSADDFREELERVERVRHWLSFVLIALGIVIVVAIVMYVVLVLL